jgi:hypothetical protein
MDIYNLGKVDSISLRCNQPEIFNVILVLWPLRLCLPAR